MCISNDIWLLFRSGQNINIMIPFHSESRIFYDYN